MRIGAKYSHLNGEEYLLAHKPLLWQEIQEVIASAVVSAREARMSKEKSGHARIHSPQNLNAALKKGFGSHGWSRHRNVFWSCENETLLRKICNRPPAEQRSAIQEAGHEPVMSYSQTDLLKDRVAVEVQFGKSALLAHDLFVKHMSLYVAGIIDVAVEIFPIKSAAGNMSRETPCRDRDSLDALRQFHSFPSVPLVLIGVSP